MTYPFCFTNISQNDIVIISIAAANEETCCQDLVYKEVLMKLRRSLAFCQAINPEGVRTLIEGNVDCLVFDLEDGVVVTRKAENRKKTLDMLRNWDCRGKEKIVRINGPGTPFYKLDMEEVIRPGLPDAIRLPKCETIEYVREVSNDLAKIERDAGLTENTIEIILMIETAEGIMNTYKLCTCSKRVTAVGIGMEDLTASMGILRRYDLNCMDLLYARQKMILEGKAAKVQVIDSGILFHATQQYIYEDSINGRYMGFDGRSCSIRYPDLIDSVNRAFTPLESEVEWAEKVCDAYEKAVEAGESDVYVDGKFIDPPVVAKAQNILNLMEQIKARQ